jgi:tetratricopeptide (TPR) repeat protein
MNTSISISVRTGIVIIACAFAAMLCWFSVRTALAAHYSELGTLDGHLKATQLEPSNATYWDLLGRSWQENLEQADPKRAIEFYRKSLSLDALSATTWLDLASAYEVQGDIVSARSAYVQAKRVYPGSADVAWRYGNFLLRQDESTAGFLEIHRAVEADPTRGLPAFLTCRHVESNVDQLLDRVLAPVASVYIDVLWQLTYEGDTDGGLKVWARLIDLHPRLSAREVFYFDNGLLNKGQAAEALRVWREGTALMGVSKLDDSPDSLIWDGGFETDLTGGGLAWRVEPHQPTAIGYDSRIRHAGKRSLRVDIPKNDYSAFVGVCQSVVLEPNSTYEFSTWFRTKDLANDGGIFFRLTHPGGQAGKDVVTPMLGGTNEWAKISVDWTSTDHPQASQVCLSKAPGEESRQRPGVAWVDDVSLVKVNHR